MRHEHTKEDHRDGIESVWKPALLVLLAASAAAPAQHDRTLMRASRALAGAALIGCLAGAPASAQPASTAAAAPTTAEPPVAWSALAATAAGVGTAVVVLFIGHSVWLAKRARGTRLKDERAIVGHPDDHTRPPR